MRERVQKEIELLRGKYPTLQHGENYDWVMIPDFPLPDGWNRKQTKLLFLIPPPYPHSAPDNFYVESGLRLGNESQQAGYSEGGSVPLGGAWGCFSWHAEIWRPSDNIEEGDNFLTFIKAVNVRLRELS